MPIAGRSIAIHSFKGGTGKSTISANLAVALALKGRTVGLMDMDLQGPGLHVILGLDPNELRFTLNDVLLEAAQPEQAAVRMNQRLGLVKGEVDFLPASVRVSEMIKTLRTGFEIESFSKTLKVLGAHFNFDYLFVDTHPGIENDTLLAMGVCDDLVVVSRLDQQDIFGTGIVAEVARSLEKPVHLLLNMIPEDLKSSEASKLANRMGANFKVQVLGWLPFSPDIMESLSKSVFILSNPRNSMTARFVELASRLEAVCTGGHSR